MFAQKVLLPLVFLCSCVCLSADNGFKTINPAVSHGRKTVGEKIVYGFSLANLPLVPSLSISFADPSKNEDILIVTQSIKSKGNKIIFRAEIIPFRTGKITFPSFNVLSNLVLPVSVTVNSVLNPRVTPNFKENYPPYQDYTDYWLITALLLVGLSLFGIVQYYRRTRAEQARILTPDQKHRLWLEVMALFQSEDLPKNLKEYYFNSSERLKEFTDRVLNTRIRELTSSEIRLLLKDSGLSQKEALCKALEQADLVKFAKYLPSAEEHCLYVQEARKFLAAHEPNLEPSPNV